MTPMPSMNLARISHEIWDLKYREKDGKGGGDANIPATLVPGLPGRWRRRRPTRNARR